ncbi:MAG: thiamine phosphate synthase [Candidatus Methanoplasma sp.]|jgi:thiamine-phosphate pyrophosphorylase|nr:thiamine phosphate synthase [Candidatus Methanoplasma sp.]
MIAAATDREASRAPFTEQVGKIARARPDVIFLRGGGLAEAELASVAAEALEACAGAGVELFASGFPGVAERLGIASGCVPLGELRESGSPFERTAVFVASEREAAEAERLGADLLVFGNVFDVSCKSCRSAKGLAALRCMCGAVDVPVLGAGGILQDVFSEVLAAEAAGVCMTSGFMRSADPSAIVAAYREAERRAGRKPMRDPAIG